MSLMIILSMQSNTALSTEQENRLKQIGATVRNAGSYIERLEDERGEGKNGRKRDGKNVCRAAVRLVVFLPYDGADLLRSFRKKAEWLCSRHRLLIDRFSCFLVDVSC